MGKAKPIIHKECTLTFAQQEMHGEEDHIVGHSTECDDDDNPYNAGQRTVVDGPVRDLVKNLFVKTTFSSLRYISRQS